MTANSKLCILALGWALSAAALGASPSAHADEPAGDGRAVAAQAMFDEGKRLVEAGELGAACEKFKESLELEYGMGTQFKLADCYQQIGRNASAWTAYLEVAGRARRQGDQARERVARERAAALEPTLAKVNIVVTSPIEGLKVTRGDVEVGGAQWGVAVPADPGEYAVRAEAPGMLPFTTRVTVPRTGEVSLTIPELAIDPNAGKSEPVPDAPKRRPADDNVQPFQILAISLLGVGAVNLGIGAVAGAISISNGSDADEHCIGNQCDADGVELRDDAIGAGDLSTLAFAIGAVAAAGGGALLIALPSSVGGDSAIDSGPTIAFGPASVTLQGSF